MNTFLKVAIIITATMLSVFVWMFAAFPVLLIVMSTPTKNILETYPFGLGVIALAFTIVFGICFAAKTIIVKL